MALMQIWSNTRRSLTTPQFSTAFPRFFSKSSPYIVKVGIPEFLNGVGQGVESHAAKLETEIGDFQKLLVTRTLKLKKLGIPCKHVELQKVWISRGLPSASLEPGASLATTSLSIRTRRKLILKYAHKYRLGLWRPRADLVKA